MTVLRIVSCFGILFFGGASPAVLADQEEPDPVRVKIQTELGDIEVLIDTKRAPVTSANFLKYVDLGHYNGGQFHRTVTMENQPNNKVRIEVIQASVSSDKRDAALSPIALERTNITELSHKDGTISMARGAPDSATSSFFICIGSQPSLDFGGARNPDGQGFAAFGQVVTGMDVVGEIQKSPAVDQTLKPPIRILKLTRIP